jgi:hypothetical protein
MSTPADPTVRDLLGSFVNAPTWVKSRQIVTDHAEVLLSDVADAEFAAWIAEKEAPGDTEAVQTLSWYRQVLQRCRAGGIAATFKNLPEPRPLNKALSAFFAAENGGALLAVVSDFPEFTSETAQAALQESVARAQAENEEAAQALEARLALRRSAGTPTSCGAGSRAGGASRRRRLGFVSLRRCAR